MRLLTLLARLTLIAVTLAGSYTAVSVQLTPCGSIENNASTNIALNLAHFRAAASAVQTADIVVFPEAVLWYDTFLKANITSDSFLGPMG